MEWIWGCMVLSLKAGIGYMFWALACTLLFGALGLIAVFVEKKLKE